MDSERCPKCNAQLKRVYKNGNLTYILCKSLVCNYIEDFKHKSIIVQV